MNEKNHFALVPRPPSVVEKAETGPNRIVSGMVADTLAIVRAKTPPQSGPILVQHGSQDLEELNRRGNAYYAGTGVKRDYVEAAKWYRLAAERGYAPAQFNLACCYQHGQGVAEDYFGQAKAWYLKAAEQGHALAQHAYYLYRIDSAVPNDEEAAKWLKKSAGQGYGWAQLQLGVNYEKGQAGFPRDHSQAATWYRRAAEQDRIGGESTLRYCYDHSPTYFQDTLAQQASLRRLVMYKLGCCYLDGRGVPSDKVEAFKWFLLAFEQDGASYPTAGEIASLEATLKPVELAESQRRCSEFKRGSVNAPGKPMLASKEQDKEVSSSELRSALVGPKDGPTYVDGEQ